MKYTETNINNVIIYIARARRSKHFRVSINSDGNAYATYPCYCSKKELIEFLMTKLDWIVKSQEKMRAKIHEERFGKEELLTRIKYYINKYVEMFNADGYNISVNKVSIRHMTSRLGSCTPSSKSIRFSTELCKYSDRYIEYVVVHELAHLIELNHSKRFWDIVKRYIGDYKKIEKYEE